MSGECFLRHGGEYAVRAEFEVCGDTGGFQLADDVGEPDRVTDVAHPVFGAAEFLGAGDATGQVGDDRNPRWMVGKPFGYAPEPVQHAVHPGRMEGVADTQPPGLVAGFAELAGDVDRQALVAGDDDRGGSVDRSDADGVADVPPGERGENFLLARLDGDHRTAAGKGLHEPGARGDERRGVAEGPDTGDVGGGELADGVSGEEARPYPPRLEQPEQRDLDREQRRLGVHRLVQQTGVLGREHDVADRVLRPAGQVQVQLGACGVEGVGIDRIRLIQLAAHSGTLAALSGEKERQLLRSGGRAAHDHVRRRPAAGQGVQPREEPVPILGHDHRAVLEQRPCGRQRIGHVHRVRIPVAGDEGSQPCGLLAQRVRSPAGQHPRQRRERRMRRIAVLLRRFPHGRGLFDDHMCVGAAHPEGGHPGAAGLTGPRPWSRLGQQPHGAG